MKNVAKPKKSKRAQNPQNLKNLAGFLDVLIQIDLAQKQKLKNNVKKQYNIFVKDKNE